MKAETVELKDIIGENGKYYVTLGPEGEKLTTKQIEELIVESLSNLSDDDYLKDEEY